MQIKAISNYTQLKKPSVMLGLGLLVTVVFVLFKQLSHADMLGWTSGFTHPLHGSDHLLAMLAVGIWAAQLRGSAIWLLPLTFVGVMSLGGVVGATGMLLPGAEVVILSSCVALLFIICKRIRFSSPINISIIAFFAFFHGFAHGQEISTSASLISYTLGFMLATLLLHGMGIIIVRLLIAVFALILSHVVYAQTFQVSENINSVKTTLAASSYTLENTDYSNANHNSASVKDITYAVNPPTVIIASPPLKHLSNTFSRVQLMTKNALFDSITFNYQTGIAFLTNGVGLTSPPLWLTLSKLCYFDSGFIHHTRPAIYSDSLLCSLNHYTRLQYLYLLATSFLTNGVGATSPPTLYPVVIALFLCLFATPFYISSALKSPRLLIAIRQFVFQFFQFNFPTRRTNRTCLSFSNNSLPLFK